MKKKNRLRIVPKKAFRRNAQPLEKSNVQGIGETPQQAK